jgi:hypothetical protein
MISTDSRSGFENLRGVAVQVASIWNRFSSRDFTVMLSTFPTSCPKTID